MELSWGPVDGHQFHDAGLVSRSSLSQSSMVFLSWNLTRWPQNGTDLLIWDDFYSCVT